MNPLEFGELLSRMKNPSSPEDLKKAELEMNCFTMARWGCSLKTYPMPRENCRFAVLFILMPAIYDRNRGRCLYVAHTVDIVLRHTMEGYQVDKNRFFLYHGFVTNVEKFISDCQRGFNQDVVEIPAGRKFINANELAKRVREIKDKNTERLKRYKK